MNFKPTPLKSIISILAGIVGNYYAASKHQIYCKFGGFCPQPTWIEDAFKPGLIIFSLIIIALVYVIWSLFQKKKK